jgi:hypothetical protein
VSDQLGPIERVTPSSPPPKVRRERTREDEGRGRRSRDEGGQGQADDDGGSDDGLPHVDVRA